MNRLLRFIISNAPIILVLFLFPVAGSFAQQAPLRRGSPEYKQLCKKMLLETLREKMRTELLPQGNVPREGNVDSATLNGLLQKERSSLGIAEEIVTRSADPQSEVHAAINPTDSLNIVVSPIRQGQTNPALLMPIYYTTNFGKTWSQSAFQTVPLDKSALVVGGGDPILTFDANGILYLSWIDIAYNGTFDSLVFAMYWASSTNGGKTFTRSNASTIFYEAAPFADVSSGNFSFQDKEWMTVDRTSSAYHNSVYCASVHIDGATEVMQLSRKLSSRDSFELPTQVSPDSLLFVQYSSLGVDRSGGVHVTYMGTVDNSNFALYESTSHDGGLTFETNKISDIDDQNLSADAIGDTIPGIRPQGNYPCAHLSIDTTGETERLYEVWCALGTTHNENHGTDIYFSSSFDDGRTWSPARVVNDDKVSGHIDHFYPSIAVNGKGVITVTWYDHRQDPSDIFASFYISQSFDHGQTWTKDVPVAGAPTDFSTVGQLNGGFGIGEYTQVLTTDGYAIPVWTDGRTGNGDLDIYAAFIPITPAGANAVQLDDIGSNIALMEAYPNPASANTIIAFSLPNSAKATLTIHDLLGREVARPVDGELSAGEHQVAFNAAGLPSGVYFYQLQTGESVLTKRFVVSN